jgi:hypothetical protein
LWSKFGEQYEGTKLRKRELTSLSVQNAVDEAHERAQRLEWISERCVAAVTVSVRIASQGLHSWVLERGIEIEGRVGLL